MDTVTPTPAARLDGYELRHLAAHLELAHRVDDLHRLLSLQTDDHKNVWYEAKEAAGDSQGYLADINRAWRLAEQAYSPDNKRETAPNIGRQYFYALIIASLNSLAANVPPGLLAIAVQEELTTPAQAFAAVQGLPNQALLAASLAELAPYLSDTPLLQQATAAARRITSDPDRDRALAALAWQWAAQQQPSKAETLLDQITDEPTRSRAIAALAPHFPSDRLPALLRRAAQLKKSNAQAVAYTALAPRLSPADQETLLTAVQKMRSRRLRALTSMAILPHLPEPHRRDRLAKTLQTTTSIRNLVTRAEITAALVPHLPQDRQDETLAALIRAIRQLRDNDKRGAAWAAIAAFLPASARDEAFADILAVENKRVRAEALEKFAPFLTHEHDLRAAVDIARQIDDRDYRVTTIAAILPHLTGLLRHTARRTAWEAAKEIKNAAKRGRAFGLLAPYLTEKMWQEALQILARSRSAAGRASIIQGIAADLPDDSLPAVLAVVRRIPPGPERAQSLAALAPRLAAVDLLPQALTTAREIADADAQHAALVALAPALATAGDQRQALDILRQIDDEHTRALALADLAPRLSRHERRQATEGIIAAVHRIKEPGARARSIEQLAARFPREMLPAAQTIDVDGRRAYALLTLLPHLPDALRPAAREQALSVLNILLAELDRVRREWEQFEQRDALTETDVWSPEGEPIAIDAFLEDEMRHFLDYEFYFLDWRKRDCVADLETLIPLLAAAGLLPEAKQVANALAADENADIWWAYAHLVPYLDEPQRTQTLENFLINHELLTNLISPLAIDAERIITLAEIAPETLVTHRAAVLHALEKAEQAQVSYFADQESYVDTASVTRARARAALAACQPQPHRRAILLDAIARAQTATTPGPVLAALLPRVAELGHPAEALAAAQTITDPYYRARALAGLSPHLSAESWPELLQQLPRLDDDSAAILLEALAPNLPQALLHDALRAAQHIHTPTARVRALIPLAGRARALTTGDTLYTLWRDILHLLAGQTRRDILHHLPALTPLATTLTATDQTTKTLIQALTHVAQAWP